MDRYNSLYEEDDKERDGNYNKDKVDAAADAEQLGVWKDMRDKLEAQIKQKSIDLKYVDTTTPEGREKRDSLKKAIEANKKSLQGVKNKIANVQSGE